MGMNRNSRRAFLSAAGSMIALPLLESSAWTRKVSAAEKPKPPKRMIFLSFGWGVTNETWFPKIADTGENYTLSEGLKPLERHKKDFTVIQNLTNKYNDNGHWGSTFYLTGANRYSEPGQSFNNSISVDQVVAEQFGAETRYSSLQLGCENASDSGHGVGLSLAWDRRGKPLPGLDNPVLAYHRLFSDDTMPLDQRASLLKQKRSVLDAVLEDAKSIKTGLSRTDTSKLDEYYQSIRDIETRLNKDEKWMNAPKARPADPVAEPGKSIAGYEEIKVMYDLMIAAFQTDATRVFTYRQPVKSLLKSVGVNVSAHDMSHYAPGPRMEASQTRDQKQSELLAYLIDQLKAKTETDGSTLFDNTVVTYGSNIRTVHSLDNCPTVVTGGAAGIKHGRHIVLKDKNTPLCNLWLTLLNGVGVNVKSHGDSTGTLSGLIG